MGENLEVSDILQAYLGSYLKKHKLSTQQMNALRAIENCRTHRLGFHLRECDECRHQEWLYNSCKNRHCPKCQWAEQQEWVQKKIKELPRAKYHHTVFTVPNRELYHLLLMNKEALYPIIFKAAANTLKTFALDPRHLGAEIGMIGVLHTWGETLNYHVHVHFIVTAGGLSKDGKEWIESKYGDKFLFPVRAMSLVFRGKFIAKLKKAYRKGLLKLTGKLSTIAQPDAFAYFIKRVARHIFRIYSKPATQKPKNVVKYLSGYMKRVAISNARLVGLEDGKVVFRYKDNREHGKAKLCRMHPHEFIRRFLNHILPDRFVRVRYYGFFAGSQRNRKMEKARALLGTLDEVEQETVESFTPLCPKCENGTMQFIEIIRHPLSLLFVCLMSITQPKVNFEDSS